MRPPRTPVGQIVRKTVAVQELDRYLQGQQDETVSCH
jgi:hypothetical protein